MVPLVIAVICLGAVVVLINRSVNGFERRVAIYMLFFFTLMGALTFVGNTVKQSAIDDFVEVKLTDVPVQGEKWFEGRIRIIYKDGQLRKVFLIQNSTQPAEQPAHK